MSTVAIFCCARAGLLKIVINKTAGKMIRKMFLMGIGKQNFHGRQLKTGGFKARSANQG
jgi:hypothetical protein